MDASRNAEENLRWKNREGKGLVDGRGEQRCQKTFLDRRMEKIGLRPESLGKKN